MYGYLLSKENIELSIAEVLHLAGIYNYDIFSNLLVVPRLSGVDRLAFTKKIYKLLFRADNVEDFLDRARKFNFMESYKGSFSVKINSLSKQFSVDEKVFADLVWKSIDKPAVDLKNSKTKLEIIITEEYILCGLVVWENQEDFEARKAHKRPELHPSSLSPRLARCLLNLVNENEITDPFCGSGGILIEAGLLGLTSSGYDNNDIMLKRARINLEFFKIQNYTLLNRDATRLKKETKAIVTDLPYGKNTQAKEINQLYSSFLSNAKLITKKMAIIFPDFSNPEKIIEKSGWTIAESFEIYIHKSITKKIFYLTLELT